jgi:hypothetical protein
MNKKKSPRNDLIHRFVKEFSQVKGNLRFQVIVTHGVIELLVNTLIEHRCKHGKRMSERRRDYPHSVKLVVLHEKGLLTDLQFKLLDWFRELRNDAVHEPFFEITPKRLEALKGVVSVGPKTPLHLPENFHELCTTFVFGLWNHHVQLFAELFMPKAKEGADTEPLS